MFSIRAGALALLRCCQRHAYSDRAHDAEASLDPTPDGQERKHEESDGEDSKSNSEADEADIWRRGDGTLNIDNIEEGDEEETEERDQEHDDDTRDFDLAVLFPLHQEKEDENSPKLGPTEHCVLSLCYYAMCRQSARAAEQFLDDLHNPCFGSGNDSDAGDRDREACRQAFQEQSLIAHHNYASARDKYYQSVRRLWDLTELFQNKNQGDHIRFIWSQVIVLIVAVNRFTKGPTREDPLRFHRIDVTATLLPSMGDNPERA
ncbi:hypothetical protein FA13DRAFT_1710955 [Coprinellus micaceus]|uniref:Uncharacterized protein n=1 Tax=Coprinellus micaceus TaxID=71717 RepID=A0A4Y7T704_COPMI|nr:hypothetical protein FA13DRAFT_1710955 [Coprinellus micaceus]